MNNCCWNFLTSWLLVSLSFIISLMDRKYFWWRAQILKLVHRISWHNFKHTGCTVVYSQVVGMKTSGSQEVIILSTQFSQTQSKHSRLHSHSAINQMSTKLIFCNQNEIWQQQWDNYKNLNIWDLKTPTWVKWKTNEKQLKWNVKKYQLIICGIHWYHEILPISHILLCLLIPWV